MVDHTWPGFRFCLSPGGRQKRKAVLSGSCGDGLPYGFSDRGKDIGMARDPWNLRARLDSALLPADKERDPVSSLPDVGLGSAPVKVGRMVCGAVALILVVVKVMILAVLAPIHERPVVTGVDHHGVLFLSGVCNGFQHDSNSVIDLIDKVPVGSELSLSLKAFMGPHRLVGAGQRKVEKVGLVGGWILFPAGRLFDEGGGFRGEVVEDVTGVEVGVSGARTNILGEANGFLGSGALGHSLVVAQVNVGNHIERGGDTEPLLKALFNWAIGEGLVEDDLALCITGPLDAKMPFSNHGSLVSVILKVAGDGWAVVFDERFIAWRKQHPALQARAPAVSTGQQAIAGRSTNRGAAVSIEKGCSGTSKTIQMGSRNLGLRVENAHVAIAHVISQDDYNVRLSGCRDRKESEYEGQQG